MALAYFLTFTTYGTWLHGTDKGMGSVDRRHNAYGAPFIAPDGARKERARSAMREPPYVLGVRHRQIVRQAIIGLAEEKGWQVEALHVRSNHVHLVIQADREPGRLMSDVKARASRDLNAAGIDGVRTRWTRHGSTRHLFSEGQVSAAVRYTLEEQGRPMARYDGTGEGAEGEEPRTK